MKKVEKNLVKTKPTFGQEFKASFDLKGALLSCGLTIFTAVVTAVTTTTKNK